MPPTQPRPTSRERIFSSSRHDAGVGRGEGRESSDLCAYIVLLNRPGPAVCQQRRAGVPPALRARKREREDRSVVGFADWPGETPALRSGSWAGESSHNVSPLLHRMEEKEFLGFRPRRAAEMSGKKFSLRYAGCLLAATTRYARRQIRAGRRAPVGLTQSCV